jgi:RNA polymerase sigma factor (TIGR02999 family)
MTLHSPHEVTDLLLAWREGEQEALGRLIPIVYRELRRLAHRYMQGEREGQPLQTTALVNEAYLRLLGCRKVNWQDRTHFLAVSARMMRRILVDYARSKLYRTPDGTARAPLDDARRGFSNGRDPNIDRLDYALEALAAVYPRKSQVVEFRFFGGLSVDETAEAMGISRDTVMRDWKLAKAWLAREMKATALNEEP